ncbi:MAG: hypothetical protein OXU20_42900 [Myxococcales bacterium]|nr:hypothetical protein [Myxococcales bacterium]
MTDAERKALLEDARDVWIDARAIGVAYGRAMLRHARFANLLTWITLCLALASFLLTGSNTASGEAGDGTKVSLLAQWIDDVVPAALLVLTCSGLTALMAGVERSFRPSESAHTHQRLEADARRLLNQLSRFHIDLAEVTSLRAGADFIGSYRERFEATRRESPTRATPQDAAAAQAAFRDTALARALSDLEGIAAIRSTPPPAVLPDLSTADVLPDSARGVMLPPRGRRAPGSTT